MTTSTSPIGTKASTEVQQASTTTNDEITHTQERVTRVGVSNIAVLTNTIPRDVAIGTGVGLMAGGPVGAVVGAAAGVVTSFARIGFTSVTGVNF